MDGKTTEGFNLTPKMTEKMTGKAKKRCSINQKKKKTKFGRKIQLELNGIGNHGVWETARAGNEA